MGLSPSSILESRELVVNERYKGVSPCRGGAPSEGLRVAGCGKSWPKQTVIDSPGRLRKYDARGEPIHSGRRIMGPRLRSFVRVFKAFTTRKLSRAMNWPLRGPACYRASAPL